MSKSDKGMATWGVHDDAGECIALITHVGRRRWCVEECRTDIEAWFSTKSQAFQYALVLPI